jgi:hypothetical protein
MDPELITYMNITTKNNHNTQQPEEVMPQNKIQHLQHA